MSNFEQKQLSSVKMRKPTKEKIYALLKDTALPVLKNSRDFMNILSSIWDVYSMKSTGEDYRYSILGNEIEKHYIDNDDWADDKLFLSILRIYDDDGKFDKFIEQIANIFQSDTSFPQFKTKLNSFLTYDKLCLHENRNNGDWTEYWIGPDTAGLPVSKNALTVYVCNSNIVNIVNFVEHEVQWPESPNCLVLTHDSLWNDYSYYTRYRLYLVKTGKHIELGELKIMKRLEEDTSACLPKEFIDLPMDFCSLGCSVEYYRQIKTQLGNEAQSVLAQLRDVALYESVYKQFENDPIMQTSLLRTNNSEKARREGRYHIYGRNMEDAYSFEYDFRLPYAKENIKIDFHYKYDSAPYERIIGIIGENGVGKTSLIHQLINSLVMDERQYFGGLRPLFSSVLMVSYSPFDNYSVGNSETAGIINYEYSGLLKNDEMMLTTEEQVKTLSENIKIIIKRKERFYGRWFALISQVISPEILNSIIDEKNENVNNTELLDLCRKASSGETMYLYSISAIMAKIRSDSLIILDEPEQHLHPKAVTALMHSIYKILMLYNSYALIATHSPYVIRELISPNVMIFKRFGNVLAVKKIGVECFGENVSLLSDVVFDTMSENKWYEGYIEEIVKKNNYDYKAALQELQPGAIELGLNAKLTIRTIINQHLNEASES